MMPKNNVITKQQLLIALNASLLPDSGLFASGNPANANITYPNIANATTIKLLRANLATATTDITTRTAAIATAKANDDLAIVDVAAKKAAMDGAPLEVIKTDWASEKEC